MTLVFLIFVLGGIIITVPTFCLFVYMNTRFKANEERQYWDRKLLTDEIHRLREQVGNEHGASSLNKEPSSGNKAFAENARSCDNPPFSKKLSPLPPIEPPQQDVSPSQSSFSKSAGQTSSIPTSSIPASSIPASSIPASSIPASSIPASSIPASSVPASSNENSLNRSTFDSRSPAPSSTKSASASSLSQESGIVLSEGIQKTKAETLSAGNQNDSGSVDGTMKEVKKAQDVISKEASDSKFSSSASPQKQTWGQKTEIFEIDDLFGTPFEASSVMPSRSTTETAPQADQKEHENSPTSPGARFELMIGRKFLGWVAAGLFILAALFFIQMVSSMGWLTLTNRILGAFFAGVVFIAFGARYFIKDLPRFGAMLTSTGIIIIFLTAYYARIRNVFPSEATTLILILSVFGGFFLSALYRSVLVGVVAILGGLAVPCLLNQHRDLMTLAIYLLLLNVAVIILINRVRKAAIASIAFLGSLLIFFAVFPMRNSREVVAGTLFFTEFWLVYYLDLFVAFFRRNRGVQKEDLARMLVTPLVCIIGLSLVYCAEPNLILSSFECSSGDFFKAYDGWIVLFLCVVYGGTTYFLYRREREFGLAPNSLSPVPMGSVVTFVSFAIMIPILLSKSFIAIAWLAAGIGLLHLYIRQDRRTVSVQTPHYRFWMTVFLILGLIRLYFIDLFPYLVSILGFLDCRKELLSDFLESSWAFPLLHRAAFPGTLSALILISGALFIKPQNVYDERNGKLRTDTAFLFLINGLVIFLILAGTDIGSFISVLIYKSSRLDPALWGWASEHFVYLLVAFAIYALGFYRKKSVIRIAAQWIIVCLLVKLCLVGIHAHPVFGGFSLKTFLNSSQNYPLPGELMDFKVIYQDHHIPMTGPYALTYAVVAVSLFLFGLFGFKIREKFPKDGKFGSAWMGTSALMFWGLASLETIAYFVTRKAEYPQTVFYSLHALWLLWLMIEVTIFIGGCCFKNHLLRWIAYGLVLLQLPIVIFYEFLWSPDMPVFALPFFNFDAVPVIAYSIFLMVIGVIVGRFGKDHYSKAECNFACCFGIAGILLCWLMLTFDIFWYLCPKGMESVTREVRWKANLALTVLWSLYAGTLLLIGFRVRAALLRWLAIAFFGLTTMKVIFVDLAFVGQIYRIGAIFALAVVLMIAAGAYQRFRPNGS